MKKWFLSLFTASLFATVNEPLRWEFFSGYRNDHIHWHLEETGEIYRDVQFWLNGLVLNVIHRDLSFFLRGAYGAFGRGKEERAHLSTTGWCADASGYFGYAINLTADRTYKVLLTPLIGYAGYFEEIHAQNTLKMVWNGFFFGGQFQFETGGPLILKAGYAYNLMHNHLHVQRSIRSNTGGNGGQSGWAQIDWMFRKIWRAGLGGEIHYFTNREGKEKLKLRWTPISGWVQISRSF